ncbi:cytochrome P450 76AD1-like [Silene latifolia]|uniref:cytochrome P450 76AD1-like n=1 Tax=Silene latifolia TaxID=37657 RepID=UPI003D776127
MEFSILALIACIIFMCFHFAKILTKNSRTNFSDQLPPGPKPIPIFGNIFDLGEKPHRSCANLAKIHGPLISLKLGTVTTIVVSSKDVAKEMFLKNDQSLSNRPIPDSVRASNHDKLSMTWLPVSAKWRNLRKIAAVQLLSPQRLDASQNNRLGKVEQLLKYVQECAQKQKPIGISSAAFTTSLNLLSNSVFSKEFANYDSSASQEFKQLMWCIMVEIGRPNYADFFPILGYIDPFGIRRRLTTYFDKLIDMFQVVVRERQQDRLTNCYDVKPTNDILDTLLNIYEDNELSMGELNHLLVDIFDAGTDTTASTLEWAMAELVKNPNIMTKVQNEFQQVLGNNCSLIKESDIPNLPYLQAIIKETFRLHPPTVFLLPRKAEVDVGLYGYTVPKNAQILVNLWAIGRDPKIWSHPEVFLPERFVGSTIDYKGRDFELLPFGAGRRICPGLGFANRMLSLMLANLLHSFDWKLANDMEPKDLDMEEKFGITLQKVEPLQVIPIPRKSV